MRHAWAVIVFSVVSVGAMAVDSFELPWMNSKEAGKNYNSSEHKNGVFVVEAYFRTCPHCNNNAPAVNDLSEKYSNDSRVQVLDVGIDRKDSLYKEWIAEHSPNHPVLKDANRKLIRQLGTTGYPSTYVVSCKGRVAFKHAGEWSSSTVRRIQQTIDGLLKDECNN